MYDKAHIIAGDNVNVNASMWRRIYGIYQSTDKYINELKL